MERKKIGIVVGIIAIIVVACTGIVFALNRSQPQPQEPKEEEPEVVDVQDGYMWIEGGTFLMGSPDSEAQRESDETQHEVTLEGFYISPYEITQATYQEVMGENPSVFVGEDLPVDNISWYDAINFANALSEKEGLTPVYTIDGDNVSWDQSANGYALPTEAQWEYAARATTTTPFNTETSISDQEANYYGHYPYLIEENYFSQGNLETQPGTYRQTTTPVGSFNPNKWGLYDMHGNVREWCWDYYGAYDVEATENPTGVTSGQFRVTRGGAWNDYAKHLRSAFRSSSVPSQSDSNIGLRLVRNMVTSSGVVDSSNTGSEASEISASRTLIVYFSWGGNTRGIAQQIQAASGADIFEIELVDPYSTSYNTVLDEAQRDLNANARPALSNSVSNIDDYDAIILGYPNWWATIPMPIATFLESYDLSGKTIIPFCSHGGGQFGQSITDISKLSPNSSIGEPLSIHYSGDSGLSGEIQAWLQTNHIVNN